MPKSFERQPFQPSSSHQTQSNLKFKYNLKQIRQLFARNNNPPNSREAGSR